MIRDLRYEEIERAERRKRLVRLTASLLLASTVASFAVSRERAIRSEWHSLPVAQPGDVGSLRARRDAIEQLIERRTFWSGVFRATSERDELVVAIHNEERLLARAEEQAGLQERRQREEAEASRMRGLQLLERGEYTRAAEQFERALAAAAPSWEHTAQVRVDLDALKRWQDEQRAVQGGAGGPR